MPFIANTIEYFFDVKSFWLWCSHLLNELVKQNGCLSLRWPRLGRFGLTVAQQLLFNPVINRFWIMQYVSAMLYLVYNNVQSCLIEPLKPWFQKSWWVLVGLLQFNILKEVSNCLYVFLFFFDNHMFFFILSGSPNFYLNLEIAHLLHIRLYIDSHSNMKNCTRLWSEDGSYVSVGLNVPILF